VNGEQVISGRELHDFLEIKYKFTDYFKHKFEKFGMLENIDYTPISVEREIGTGKGLTDFIITLDIAKQICMLCENVFVLASDYHGKDYSRWLYTATTRAKKNLIIKIK
jgi:anti-repressor protein